MEKEGKKCEGTCGEIVYRDGKPYAACGSVNCQTHGKSPLPQEEKCEECLANNISENHVCDPLMKALNQNARFNLAHKNQKEPAKDGNGGMEYPNFASPTDTCTLTRKELNEIVASEIKLAEERLVAKMGMYIKAGTVITLPKDCYVVPVESIVSTAKGEGK